MIENINIRCIFYFILFYFIFFYVYEKMRFFLFSTLNFFTQVKGKRRTNKKLNSTTSEIQQIFFDKNA